MKEFHLGDILSITSHRLVSPRKIEGVYDILNYMTKDNLMTHQLPRAAEVCGPPLSAFFPWTEEIQWPNDFDDADHVWHFLAAQVERYGAMHEVPPLAPGVWEHRNPLEELAEMMRPDQEMLVVGV